MAEPEERSRGDQGDWRPRPDPTVLTTEALHREVSTLRELIEARIDTTDTLVNEKFTSIDRQLALVERQRVEQKADTRAAVDAALIAQKEAVREQTIASEKAIQKSESSTIRQLEQITATFSTAMAGITTALDDIKERVSKIEAIKIGGNEAKTGIYAMAGFILTIVLVVTALGAAAVFRR